MSEQELVSTIKQAVAEAIKEQPQVIHADCPFVAEDISFVHTWRTRIEKFATAIGLSVIAAICAVIYFLIQLGFEAWRKL